MDLNEEKLNQYRKQENQEEMTNASVVVQTNIEDLCNDDFILVNIFGTLKELRVFSTGDNRFGESGHYKKYKFKLNKKELDVLKWFLENVNIEDYKEQILEFCNNTYAMWCDEKIALEDVSNEVDIHSIAIHVTDCCQANDGSLYPEISFYGECNCDKEHGICIGFRNKKFIGISSQDWII